MSLIEEALRRVKDPLVPPASSAPAKPTKTPRQARGSPVTPTAHSWSPVPSPSSSRPPHPSSPAPLTMVAVAVLALTAALIFGGAVWLAQGSRGPGSAQPPASKPADSNHATADASTQPAQPDSKALAEEFNVTGVVEGLGDPYAVINGSIVAVGETVGSATLTGISEGKVTLRLADGKETVVQVER